MEYHAMRDNRALSVKVDQFFSRLDKVDQQEQLKEEPTSHVPESVAGNAEHNGASMDMDDAVSKKLRFDDPRIFELRHSISYWISISFLFGAILFFSGSIFWIYDDVEADDSYILVVVAFFVGTVAFLIGSYLGLYEVINIDSSDETRYLLPKDKKDCRNMSWIAAMSYFVGCLFYQITVTNDVLQITYPPYSAGYWLILKLPLFIGGIFFGVGGIGEIVLNKGWMWRPTKLAFYTAWLNGVGGIMFFIAGVAYIASDENVRSVQIPYVLGSFGYMAGGVLSLMMWKLQQFGLVYLPDLNRELTIFHSKKGRAEIVLYTDIFFLCIFCLSAATGVYAVTFATLCEHYKDWAKNFALSTVISVGVIALGSVMHRVPTKRPYKYLVYLLRFYLCWDMINMMIDTYNISGDKCHSYGH